jgi:hypothetical protein
LLSFPESSVMSDRVLRSRIEGWRRGCIVESADTPASNASHASGSGANVFPQLEIGSPTSASAPSELSPAQQSSILERVAITIAR